MAELKTHLRESVMPDSAAFNSALCGRQWAELLTLYAHRVTCKACRRALDKSRDSYMERNSHATV